MDTIVTWPNGNRCPQCRKATLTAYVEAQTPVRPDGSLGRIRGHTVELVGIECEACGWNDTNRPWRV